MTILYVIIGIVFCVSMYEFFSTRSWQLITSSKRNDIIFDQRNKAYGAYEIRKNYDRELVLIMCGVLTSVGVIAMAVQFFSSSSITSKEIVIPIDDDNDTSVKTVVIPLKLITEKQESGGGSNVKVDQNLAGVVVDNGGTSVNVIENQHIQTGAFSNTGADGQNFQTGTTVGNGGGDLEGNGGTITPTVIVPTSDPDFAAEYPGGKDKMVAFLQRNLVYPGEAIERGASGKVYLSFVVDKEGKIVKIKVDRGVPDCPECDAEAIRVLRKMPNWKPARKEGVLVDSYYKLPINFSFKG